MEMPLSKEKNDSTIPRSLSDNRLATFAHHFPSEEAALRRRHAVEYAVRFGGMKTEQGLQGLAFARSCGGERLRHFRFEKKLRAEHQATDQQNGGI